MRASLHARRPLVLLFALIGGAASAIVSAGCLWERPIHDLDPDTPRGLLNSLLVLASANAAAAATTPDGYIIEGNSSVFQEYVITLGRTMSAPAIVTLTTANGQLLLNGEAPPLTLTFTAAQSSQIVRVTAADVDTVARGRRSDTIYHTVTSADANYDGQVLKDVAISDIRDNEFRVYATDATFTGAIQTYVGGAANAIVAADALCMQDTAYPGAGTYKAMLVDNGNRVACSTGYCPGGAAENRDWAMLPGTSYYRPDGTTYIGKTTAYSLIIAPLAVTFHSKTAPADYWTGMLDGAQLWSARDCDVAGVSWQLGNACGENGGVGQGAVMTYFSYANSSACCNSLRRLLCVEQQ